VGIVERLPLWRAFFAHPSVTKGCRTSRRRRDIPWHVAQMLPRLDGHGREQDLTVSIPFENLDDESSIVRTFSMQALADLAIEHERFRKRVIRMVEFLARTGRRLHLGCLI